MRLLASFLLSHNSKNISYKLIKQCDISKALTSELLKVLVKNRVFHYPSSSKARYGACIFSPSTFKIEEVESQRSPTHLYAFPPSESRAGPPMEAAFAILRAVLPHWVRYPNQHSEGRRQCPKEARRAEKRPPWLERGTSRRRRKTRERCKTQGFTDAELGNPRAERTMWWANWTFFTSVVGPMIKFNAAISIRPGSSFCKSEKWFKKIAWRSHSSSSPKWDHTPNFVFLDPMFFPLMLHWLIERPWLQSQTDLDGFKFRFPGNLLQYSCSDNPMDRGA